MIYDHRSNNLHRADLDREIDSIRTERFLASDGAPAHGPIQRARQVTGRALVAAGSALMGRDAAPLHARRV